MGTRQSKDVKEQDRQSDGQGRSRRFPWLTKKLVITIVAIYAVITIAAILWTTYVSGWDNDLWMFWLW